MKLNYRSKMIAVLFLSSAALASLFQNCSNRNFSSQDGVNTSSSLSSESMDCSIAGETVAENDSRVFFLNSTVPIGSTCQPENRICKNGFFTGSYQYSTCEVAAPASCAFRGNTIAHGQTITAFLTPAVPFGQSCASEPRTCDNGTLYGTYEFNSCTPGAPLPCTFNGLTVQHGASVQSYQYASVAFGQSCGAPLSKTCNNGNLVGGYQYPTCNVGLPLSCLFNGVTHQHGANVMAYKQNITNDIFGRKIVSSCNSYPRLCNNGNFGSPTTYNFGSCPAAGSPASCLLDGITILNGQSKLFYSSTSPPCNSQPRSCSYGLISGNSAYKYFSCSY